MRASLASVSLVFALVAVASLAGCAGNDGGGIPGASESDYTSEAGAEAPRADSTSPAAPSAPDSDTTTTQADAGAPSTPTPVAPITPVPPYTDGDIGLKPRLRFSIDGVAPVEAAGVTLEIVISGADRRFKVTGGTPAAPSSRPVVYAEFGKGAALVEPGIYDCATLQAVVVMVKPDGSKLSTVQPGPQRRCQVVVDQATVVTASGGLVRSVKRVTAHFDADLGPHQSVGGTVSTVSGALASIFTELKSF
jgi:hypothetical protein